MNNGTQNYVLTKKQLYILLVGCGGESVRGLKIDGDVPDKAEIIKTIGELSDRGYVVSDGNNFHTVGDIDKIIKLIMFAPDFYIIKGRNNVPDLCCYGDKKQFAGCEVMVTKADSIRISVCDFESLFSKLFDEGYFENCFDEYFVGDDELREFEARYLEKRDISCENNGSSRRVFSIDKIRAGRHGSAGIFIGHYFFWRRRRPFSASAAGGKSGAVGVRTPVMIFKIVDLPEPLVPIIPTHSPS